MKILYLFLSLLAAALAEWTLARSGFALLPPPLVLFAVTAWFPLLGLPGRIGLAVIAGVFLDSVSLLPTGTFIILLVLLALITEFFVHAFTDIASPFIHAASAATLLLIALFLREFIGAGLHILRHEPSFLSARLTISFALPAFLWACILPVFLFATKKIYKKYV